MQCGIFRIPETSIHSTQTGRDPAMVHDKGAEIVLQSTLPKRVETFGHR